MARLDFFAEISLQFSPPIASVRLAFAAVNTGKEDVKYIETIHNCFKQVWQLLGNSPKKIVTFIKIQASVNTVQITTKGEKAMATKLQKACKTHWLSFGV